MVISTQPYNPLKHFKQDVDEYGTAVALAELATETGCYLATVAGRTIVNVSLFPKDILRGAGRGLSKVSRDFGELCDFLDETFGTKPPKE